MEGNDELISAIYGMKRMYGWIDCCNVWNELMNWLLQCMKLKECKDELIAVM